MRDYLAIAEQYIDDVLSGHRPASKWEKMACGRQRNDRQFPPTGYVFDDAKAIRPCKFLEMLRHFKGPLAGELFVLEPWQIFITTTVFGWVESAETQYRRFQTVYLEIPRKAGKSFLTAGIALYCTFCDGEGGAEAYTAATKGDQARIVFDVAKAMVDRSPGMQSRFGVQTTLHVVSQPNSLSTLKPINADAKTQDGLNIHFASLDELHAHKRRDLWDVLETGTGARAQPIIWAITTAGSNRSGICYEQRIYLTKILDGVVDDASYFGIIYTVDDEDLHPEVRDRLFHDEQLWIKANPNYGVSARREEMQRLGRKAREMPSSQNNFLTKRLNVWVNADVAWMDMAFWGKCGDTTLSEADFADAELIIGCDLATVRDMTAIMRVYRTERSDGAHYTVFGSYYLPSATVEAQDERNASYSGWEQDGYLTVTEGMTTDLDQVRDDLIELAREKQTKDVVFDPHNAIQMMQQIEKAELTVSKVAQSRRNFNEPMRLIEQLVLERKLHHDGNPILAWMISNTVANTNAADELFPTKEVEGNKIDGVVGMIMAMRRWIDGDADNESDSPYQDRGLRTL